MVAEGLCLGHRGLSRLNGALYVASLERLLHRSEYLAGRVADHGFCRGERPVARAGQHDGSDAETDDEENHGGDEADGDWPTDQPAPSPRVSRHSFSVPSHAHLPPPSPTAESPPSGPSVVTTEAGTSIPADGCDGRRCRADYLRRGGRNPPHLMSAMTVSADLSETGNAERR